jgi:hypothetical protein
MMRSKALFDRHRTEPPLNVDRTTERTPTIAAVVMTAVCTTWVVVALIHPTSLTDETRPMWVVVHIAQLIFAPIVAMGVLALLKGAQGPAAALARGTAVLWAAWFSAYDAVAGIATGILIGGDAREAGEYLYAHDLIEGLGWVAVGMWLLTAIPAGLVLRGSKPLVTPVALFISALIFTHAGPPAAVGFAALAFAMWTGLTTGDQF